MIFSIDIKRSIALAVLSFAFSHGTFAADVKFPPADIRSKFLEQSLSQASRDVLKADRSVPPAERFKNVSGPKQDNAAMSKLLLLKSTEGPVTKEEIAALEQYILAYPLPRLNIMNYHFRRVYVPEMVEWTYERTKNPALLEKAVRMAYSTAVHRNDRFSKEDCSKRGPAPLWPHYRGAEKEGDKFVVPGGIADTSALAWLTYPVRMIARHPEVWDTKLDGVRYQDIALDLMRESFKTSDWVVAEFHEPATHLLKSPSYWTSEPTGFVPQWNRVFPLMASTIPLIEACETFKIETDRAKTLDQINGAMIDEFWKHARTEGEGENQRLLYSYGIARGPNQVEDFQHGSFDGRHLEVFYRSKRYHFTKEQVRALANTVASACRGPGDFTDRINGKGKVTKQYDYLPGMEGYLWYAPYNAKVKTDILDYVAKRWGSEKPESRVVWGVLKLRDSTTKVDATGSSSYKP